MDIYKMLKETGIIENYPNEFLIKINLDWTNIYFGSKTLALRALNSMWQKNIKRIY